MKLIWALVVLSLNVSLVYGQKRVKVNADFYKETKYVKKDGTEEGKYQMKTKRGRTLINGNFENGKRVGTWYFYDRGGKEYLTFDFDNNEILSSKIKLQVKKGDKWMPYGDAFPHSDQIGEFVFLMHKEFDYPEMAYKNYVEGTVVVAVELDENGFPSKSELLRDIGAGLGEEALRLINLLKIKWDIPNDNSYRLIIPVKFIMK